MSSIEPQGPRPNAGEYGPTLTFETLETQRVAELPLQLPRGDNGADGRRAAASRGCMLRSAFPPATEGNLHDPWGLGEDTKVEDETWSDHRNQRMSSKTGSIKIKRTECVPMFPKNATNMKKKTLTSAPNDNNFCMIFVLPGNRATGEKKDLRLALEEKVFASDPRRRPGQ